MNNQNGIGEIFDDFLEHHGIKGQAWGKRHGPPYPLVGADRERAKKAYEKEKERKRQEKQKAKIQKRIEKAQKKQIKQKIKEQKSQERQEEKERKASEDLVKEKKKYSRDPKKLYEHREMYTAEEIAECIKTFEMDAKVKSYIDKNYERSKSNMARFADWGSSMVRAGTTAVDAYNLYVSVNRHLGGDAKPFKLYNRSGGGDEPKKNQND